MIRRKASSRYTEHPVRGEGRIIASSRWVDPYTKYLSMVGNSIDRVFSNFDQLNADERKRALKSFNDVEIKIKKETKKILTAVNILGQMAIRKNSDLEQQFKQSHEVLAKITFVKAVAEGLTEENQVAEETDEEGQLEELLFQENT